MQTKVIDSHSTDDDQEEEDEEDFDDEEEEEKEEDEDFDDEEEEETPVIKEDIYGRTIDAKGNIVKNTSSKKNGSFSVLNDLKKETLVDCFRFHIYSSCSSSKSEFIR